MKNIIIEYIKRLTKEDIIKYASRYNLKLSSEELDFIYSFIKDNYNNVLDNPNKYHIEDYKSKFSEENYVIIKNLVNKYKNMV